MMNQWRNLKPLFRRKCREVCPQSKLYYSEEIKIPKRVPRGPTDILKAISSTVGRDPTAAHFKYHDDPYLLPHSNPSKRTYALAQEAGRKAAHWIRSEHAELFQHRVADPFVNAFAPKPSYTEESKVNEDVLKHTIRSCQVTDSVTIYELLKKKGESVSPEVEQSLLELVCFYNGDEPSSEEWIEERWFKQHNKRSEKPRKTWKYVRVHGEVELVFVPRQARFYFKFKILPRRDGGFADKLFNDMVPRVNDPSKAYCAVISGMLTFGQVDLGWQRYEEAKKKQLKLNTTVYNKLISKAGAVRESSDLIGTLIQSLLVEMNAQGLQPNVITLNSALESLISSYSGQINLTYILNLVAEFRQIGIEPSLATFYHLIESHVKDKRKVESVMADIIEKVGSRPSWTLVDPKDVLFFVRAMDVICHIVKSREMALNLDSVLHKGENYNLIGDSYAESSYFRYFFTILLKTGTLQEFMVFYDDLVPYIYTPEPNLMMDILNSVELEMAWDRLGKFWGDLVLFEHVERSPPLEKMLNLIAQALSDSTLDADTKTSVVGIAWSIWERMEDQTRLKWSGQMLGDAIFSLTVGDELAKAHVVADRLFTSPQSEIMGEPQFEALRAYIDACIAANNATMAMKCLQFCAGVGFLEAEESARKCFSECALSDRQRNKLTNLYPALRGL